MAQFCEVTKTFKIGDNEFKKGTAKSFSDELASKYSANLKKAIKADLTPVKKKKVKKED